MASSTMPSESSAPDAGRPSAPVTCTVYCAESPGRYWGLSVAMLTLSWWLTGGTLRFFVPWYITPLRRYWADTQMPGSSWEVTDTSRMAVASAERITWWLRRSRPSMETSTGVFGFPVTMSTLAVSPERYVFLSGTICTVLRLPSPKSVSPAPETQRRSEERRVGKE